MGPRPEWSALPPPGRRLPPDLCQHHLFRDQRGYSTGGGVRLRTTPILRAYAPLVPAGVDLAATRATKSGDLVGGVLGGNPDAPSADRRGGGEGVGEQRRLPRSLYVAFLALLPGANGRVDSVVWGIRP